jgi:uncharacterized iron-regulated membrane protein
MRKYPDFISINDSMQLLFQRLLTRSIWLKVHLYLALIAGFFFALIGLSGSLSIYREELDGLFNPPKRLGSWTLEMPRSPQDMITAWYDKPTETFFELYAPLMVSVNPYTGDVVTSRFWGETATTWLLDLHTQLRQDRFGWNAVGILGYCCWCLAERDFICGGRESEE